MTSFFWTTVNGARKLTVQVEDRGAAGYLVRRWYADEGRWVGARLGGRGTPVPEFVPAATGDVPADAARALDTQTGDSVSLVTNAHGRGSSAQAVFFGSDK